MTDYSTVRKAAALSTKNLSCVACRKKKIKCDRQNPCSSCVKSSVECIFREYVPPTRHYKRRAEFALLSRMKHYENLLRKHGIDPSFHLDDNGAASTSPADPHTETAGGTGFQHLMNTLSLGESQTAIQPPTGQFISKDGKSLYLENDFWEHLGTELEDSDYFLDDDDADSGEDSPSTVPTTSFLDDSVYQMLFAAPSKKPLTSLHPDPVHIFKLWQVFLESIDPLTKIIHHTIVQQQILNAVSDLRSIGKELEALMFSIYSCALLAMTDEQVQQDFGQEKGMMQARIRMGVERALANASLMNTSDVTVLQAFSLYLISLRSLCDRRTLWCLSGLSIRIAQQIGIHRDGSQLGLSVFETEMRRRIWWHIVYTDRTIARASGFVAAPLPANDTHLPLNINDSDLHPNMKDPPTERENTSTDMIFCQLKHEFGKWQDRQSTATKESMFSGNSLWLPSARNIGRRVTAEEAQNIPIRLQVVDELEETFKNKLIRHCNPSIPLHLLVILQARLIIGTLRLAAYHPCHLYGEKRKLEPLSQAEKDLLLSHWLEVTRCNEKIHSKNSLKQFLWQLDSHFPWPALFFKLSELPYLSILDEDTLRTWRLIDNLFMPQLLRLTAKAQGPLHTVCIKLAFKAWNVHEDESRRHGIPVPPRPKILDAVSSHMTSASKSEKGALYHQWEQPQTQEQSNSNKSRSPIPNAQLAEAELTGAKKLSIMDNRHLLDFSGGEMHNEPPPDEDEDGLLMDWINWDPIFQHMPSSFEMSGLS